MINNRLNPVVLGLLGLLALTVSVGRAQSSNDAYAVEIDPANFVEVIDNPYFPHLPGMRWVYVEQTADGFERNVIEVLADKREIMGVQATVVHDQVYLNGEIVEDTFDWYAQDKEGNVWYLGEAVKDYADGKPMGTGGSWEAGVDGAMPGIVMYADPAAHLGESYLQEYYAGEAEDTAVMLSDQAEGVTTAYGAFDEVVMTYDFTPLDPGTQEIKFFAQGIGEIKAVNLVTNEESVLVEFSAP